jgi:hypothetical protein
MVVNDYAPKVMTSILTNPMASRQSMEGIVSAANQEPGSVANQIQYEKQQLAARNQELRTPSSTQTMAAVLTYGQAWKQLRAELNSGPTEMDKLKSNIAKSQAYLRESLPSTPDLLLREINAQDAARQKDRRELQSEFNRRTAVSGKNTILSQVRRGYTSLQGANLAAVRKAFDRLAG